MLGASMKALLSAPPSPPVVPPKKVESKYSRDRMDSTANELGRKLILAELGRTSPKLGVEKPEYVDIGKNNSAFKSILTLAQSGINVIEAE